MCLLFSLASFFFPPPIIQPEDPDERALVPACGRTSCFLDHVLDVFFPESVFIACFATISTLQPGPSGMFVCAVFYGAIFFFNHHCGKTGMCHYLLLAAAVRKPNYHGSQCLVAVYRCAVSICVCVCVCVGLVLVSSCPKPQWQRLREMVTVASADSGEKEAVKLTRDLLCVALPPWHRSPPAPPLFPYLCKPLSDVVKSRT